MKKYGRVILCFIIFIAFIARFYQLGKVPNGLEWDEVAIGYDSYSLLHTGRDQFGQWFPITFRSLDDYKPPLYNYSALLPIALFGLNAFAVRFPSAFFGTISVFGCYLVVKEFFRKEGREKNETFIESLALLSAFFFALSPWHLQFSRAAFEVNLSLTFLIFGVYSFLRGVRETKWLSIAALLFGFGLFSYHSSRVVVPLLVLTMVILFRKELRAKKQTLIKPIVVLSLFILAFLPIAFSKEAQIRLTVTNFLNPAFPYGDEVDYKAIASQLIQQDEKAGDYFWGKIFHNRRIAFVNYDNALKVARNYLMHFHPQFLFVNADVPLHHAPGMGLLYIWDLPFLLLGLVIFLRNHKTKYAWPLLIWMLIAPIPASITRQAPHAVRTELILPTFHIFTALGFLTALSYIRKKEKLFMWGFLVIMLPLFLFNVGYYLHEYYVHTDYEVSDKWLYGRKEAATFTDSIKGKYKKVIVSTRLEQPHVFFLFYLKYDPLKYLKEGGTASGGWGEDRNHFDKYEFKPIDFAQMSKEKDILFVGLANEFPPGAHIIKTIYYLNGQEGINIVSS